MPAISSNGIKIEAQILCFGAFLHAEVFFFSNWKKVSEPKRTAAGFPPPP
jgi:hypothetical protein